MLKTHSISGNSFLKDCWRNCGQSALSSLSAATSCAPLSDLTICGRLFFATNLVNAKRKESVLSDSTTSKLTARKMEHVKMMR